MKGKCGRETDGRSRRPEVAEALRIQGAKAVAAGEHYLTVARTLGVSERTVLRWVEQYGQGGAEALKRRPQPGRRAELSREQLADIALLVATTDPRAHGFEFGLWTCSRVQALIEKRYGVRYTTTWVGVLLHRLGLSPQRPQVRAAEQDVEAVAVWRKDTFPELKQRAATEGAKIYFGDECGVRSQGSVGRTWGREGQTPEVVAPGAYFGMNLISAVAAHGELEFMPVDGRVNSGVFVRFLEKLIAGRPHKVILVLDNARYHKSSEVQGFVSQHEKKLELVFLPPYAPQTNPDEQVWASVKRHVRDVVPRTKEEFRKTIIAALWWLQEKAERVKAFFHHPDARYAL